MESILVHGNAADRPEKRVRGLQLLGPRGLRAGSGRGRLLVPLLPALPRARCVVLRRLVLNPWSSGELTSLKGSLLPSNPVPVHLFAGS